MPTLEIRRTKNTIDQIGRRLSAGGMTRRPGGGLVGARGGATQGPVGDFRK